MWGTYVGTDNMDDPKRFIPTHVGNICIVLNDSSGTSVHPHACGEHLVPVTCMPESSGSSPRMWGTFPWRSSRISAPRFIPTHVGNISQSNVLQSLTAVHPHACGEHSSQFPVSLLIFGSSPRMWGTCENHDRGMVRGRFIPTHVGNIPHI